MILGMYNIANWISKCSSRRFWKSYTFKVTVADLIGERAINTFWLSLLSVILLYANCYSFRGISRYDIITTLLDKSIVLYSFITMQFQHLS